ncbi:GGDEF domain-containing protein [Lacrimispora sp.]|uniref:GGDEF domain-containing protein n=1 Tax=Lacrimispora sp. TaxID=2719234 RepID=UPI00345F47B7
MSKFKFNSSSIVYRLTGMILGIILLQTILFGTILIQGGVIEEAKSNAYRLFHEKAASRKDYIQREMKNNWTNFDPYVTNIAKLLNGKPQSFDTNSFFDAAVSELIPMLRTTQVTGAYIILNDESDDSKGLPAVYLRDYDPIMNSYSNDDIYMVYGPSHLAKSLKIPLDQIWRYTFEVTETNRDFIKKPYDKASMTSKATLLGYWSKPFKLQPEDVSIITYSIPLFDSAGILRGTIGIEITLSYLEKYFPATELQPRDSLGYLIAYSEEGGEQLSPIIMGGALQKRMIDEAQPLSLEAVEADMNIYLINNHKGKERLFASVEKVGLYQYNTPFEKEQWYLVGIMREDYLLSYAVRIKQILWISLCIALLLGAVSASFISIQVSKPIVKLAHQVNDSNQLKAFRLDRTGLFELDELCQAIELANKRTLESASRLAKIVELFGLPIGAYEISYDTNTVFVTHNFYDIIGWNMKGIQTAPDAKAFEERLKDTLLSPTADEIDVYEIGNQGSRWIRFKQTEQQDAVIGVVLDVTDEILKKRQIMRERDHDSLTMLLNRKGFQWSYEAWAKSRPHEKKAALIMFDLDNLKSINDTYGHKWGDQYIIMAVEYLSQMAPASNVLLGRRSGDEFVVLLHGFESRNDIRNCMNNFYKKLQVEQILFPDGRFIPVMISAGVMWIEGDGFSYDELLHFADEALYEAKRNRKGFYLENI